MSVFDHKKNINRNYPAESGAGTIKLAGNRINYTEQHPVSVSEVRLEDLQYAYVVVTEEQESFLFLFDHHRHYIPAEDVGFKDMYEALSAKFTFDDAVFFEHIMSIQPVKKIIWRRTYEPTYDILTGFTDYSEGFEIQSPEKEFVSWDTTYEELAKNPYVRFKQSPYIQKISKFAYPIRLGNILLRNFHVYYDQMREDVSVLQFYSDCFDALGTDKSYDDLKRILLKDLGIDRNRFNYEREDQKNLNYNFGGMSLSICYTYDSKWNFDGGYTALSVENKRDYFSLLIDQPYEEGMVVSNYALLPEGIRVSEDYKRNSKIKRRPRKITDQFGDKPIIWMDERNSKIGFSSRFFSQVFDVKDIKTIRIQNVLPAKGVGGSSLEVELEIPQGQYAIVMKGDCRAFDSYADKIKALTGKEVIFEIEYYDC
ncbi:hypothetical protein [Cytophaga hutchinsonii]|uniref:Uncharacterized protein n=1 Tax=Cytophaga hutchinsonii (strain ATCC 33406 / DSM 1761 / CIP 103989 / NBRC 15051 / NCIMB 9469 / D465) TaxID=269798 RepID=A0A6N4STJ6_CYTH3|nr:hypothetical protein [Cytophaga hutchinsonii]ABG59635.1 conserved hypothetical protein [Cytophaga hutchinsonii ATCC 33406]SFX66843.1 hypothetical protein SAMN04487930_107154 [Cytophaga hutchinsonii ATCC 33406]